jgi:hypothetical protein
MSAQSIAHFDGVEPRKLLVSFRWLLGLYAIIPVCLLLQAVDAGFWQGYLRDNLPSSPSHFLLFQVLFGTPHIIASAVLLVTNGEYVQHFKGKILLMTAAVALVFGVGSLFIPYRVLYIAVACWTVLHVLKQQHGVARGVCRLPDWAYHLLLWLSVAAGIFIYIGIFLNKSLDVGQVAVIKQVAGVLCVALLLGAVVCQQYINTRFGKWFMWANVGLVLSSFYLYDQQYYFLAILVPRLVHDATAYIFYVIHDYNKHHTHPQNGFYRFAAVLKLPIFLVLPVFTFVLAFVLQAYGDGVVNVFTQHILGVEFRKVVTVGLLGYLGLLHYYTESITWKQDSPYRQFIGFSK